MSSSKYLQRRRRRRTNERERRRRTTRNRARVTEKQQQHQQQQRVVVVVVVVFATSALGATVHGNVAMMLMESGAKTEGTAFAEEGEAAETDEEEVPTEPMAEENARFRSRKSLATA